MGLWDLHLMKELASVGIRYIATNITSLVTPYQYDYSSL